MVKTKLTSDQTQPDGHSMIKAPSFTFGMMHGYCVRWNEQREQKKMQNILSIEIQKLLTEWSPLFSKSFKFNNLCHKWMWFISSNEKHKHRNGYGCRRKEWNIYTGKYHLIPPLFFE